MGSILVLLKVTFYVLKVINEFKKLGKKEISFADAAKKYMEWFEKNRKKMGKEFVVDQGLKDLEDMSE